jgi:hypothetical protein
VQWLRNRIVWLVAFVVVAGSTVYFAMQGKVQSKTLSVFLSTSKVLDPLRLQTMADYDYSLCLYRTWFEYDEARRLLPGLVEKWVFDSNSGFYTFYVDERARWSTGLPILGSQLVANLKRAIESGNQHGKSIAALIEVSSIEVAADDRSFKLATKSKKPSESFFQRMGAVFLSPVHPSAFGNGADVVSNEISSGPYRIKSATEDKVILEPNPHDFLASPERATGIEITRRGLAPTNPLDLLDSKSRFSIVHSSSLLPEVLAATLSSSGLTTWTRGFDRVSLFRPIPTASNELRQKRRTVLKRYLNEWPRFEVPKHVLNVQKASSLQPRGYPLYDPIKVDASIDGPHLGKIKIVAIKGLEFEYQSGFIVEAFKRLKIDVEWVLCENFANVERSIAEDAEIDFELFSFGVADPEPSTWLSLVLNPDSPFVELAKDDSDTFNSILLRKLSLSDEAEQLRRLLREIGERGSYAPVFHFSSLIVGRRGLKFTAVNELDETVPLPKIKFE